MVEESGVGVRRDIVGNIREGGCGVRREIVGLLEREVVVLEEILLGMNSRSFELLFILR